MKDEFYVTEGPFPETPPSGEEPKPWKNPRIIGEAVPRVDAYERLSGSAVYPSDVRLPNMLYAAVLRCPHPHATVKSIDADRAEKMPGVRAVIGAHTAEAKQKWTYRGGFEASLFDRLCRYEGEPVAAVAADTPFQAADAAKKIKVAYSVHPAIADERDALENDAPKIHENGNVVNTESYERGDTAKGFTEADVVIETSYRTACEFQSPMELHGCVADWRGDRLTIWESTQGVYTIQETVSEILDIPLSKVRVIGRYMGGGFGSKLETDKTTIIAVLLAKRTGRPVKYFMTRADVLLTAGNRPPTNMRLKAGVKKDGTLTALEYSVLATGGAYKAGGIAIVDTIIKDLYTCPNVKTELKDVYINAGPARPFRAPGHPQAAWAMEQMMDTLAEKIGMDPVRFRLKNVPTYSQFREGQPPYTTTGLSECLNRGAEAFGWKEALEQTAKQDKTAPVVRGVGMAACNWIVGGGWPPSTVIIKLFADGSVNLNMGASDIGTGTKTVMALTAAEELGVKPEAIQIEHADTKTTQWASSSGGSKTVPTEAPTVRAAAIEVKRELLSMAAKDLETEVSDLTFEGDEIVSRSDSEKKVRIWDVSGLKKQKVVVGVGYRGPNPEDKAIVPFGAQFCEVEVNKNTGEVKILRFVAAHDSGRVMSRKTYDNQVFGGITMGIGLSSTEERVLDRGQTGKLLSRNLHDYKLPTSMDVPVEQTSVPIEMPDDEANTTGAKGLGEPVTIPTAAAVANAVYNAVGVRVTETPLTPVRLMARLHEKEA